eukprot:TRINITY_DN4961_c0_g1_i1.p1 TRINITY_DN4961_c0_g1~~TRINITY_DN4961_c0_g1_i1.p1  ORF type:complete len:520 (+),score=72.82 TRINITY_DN4961_c0_g1_i1:18-1577(+)
MGDQNNHKIEKVTPTYSAQERLGADADPSLSGGAEMYASRQRLAVAGKVKAKSEVMKYKIDVVESYTIPHLLQLYKNMPSYPNRFVRTKLFERYGEDSQDKSRLQYNQMISDDEIVLFDIVRRNGLKPRIVGLPRAGPRKQMAWKPGEVVACVVTCGGLCPGLNDCIEELVRTLYYNYGVDTIFGVRNGYRGFYDRDFLPWMTLTPRKTEGIHFQGGTILGSSRGGMDVKKGELDRIMHAIVENGINQVYIIGGDGSHRGAYDMMQEAGRRKYKLGIACIPKTIDNDIGIIDRSFGFDTAVAEAEKAVMSAVVEAKCSPNGIGIVLLMGRHAGFIAAHATLSSNQVDLCLIPEVPFELEGPRGILGHIENVVNKEGHAVIVVAEGAGKDIIKSTGMKDESGNPVLPEIGLFLKEAIRQHFKKKKKSVAIKYHDPSYMIRSVRANAADSIYCTVLAANAVHGAMAGYTGFTSATVNNRSVFIPIPLLVSASPCFLNPHGRTWERVLSSTQQPSAKIKSKI